MNSRLSSLLKNFFQKSFWIVATALLFLGLWMVFANFLTPLQAFIRAVVAFLFFGTIIFLNLRLLIPSFLRKQQFFQYTMLVLLICFMISMIRYYVESKLEIDLSLIRNNAQWNRPRKFVVLFFNHSVVFLLSLTYYFGQQWLSAARREAQLKSERLEAEINLLKSQVNPHFLMNTLNNLYSLSYLKDDRTPEMLLKLSALMRYLLYECSQATVPLEKEIDFLKNFFELQKLKNKNYERVTIDMINVGESHLIPPLLLLPFFENLFKHADIETNTDGKGFVEVRVSNETLMFRTGNSKKSKTYFETNSGFGLRNIKQRLHLLFGERFKLEIKDEEIFFNVHLEIPLT